MGDRVDFPPVEPDNRPPDHNGSPDQLNIHFSPELMAGVYANHVAVRRSAYEFTLEFAQVDSDEPTRATGVARVILTPRFAAELLNAVCDNYDNWDFRERVRSLPEAPESDAEDDDDAIEEQASNASLHSWAMAPSEQPTVSVVRWPDDLAASVYANFANVSHSDYEFTVTFVRLDYEVEVEEIPGVVVCRVSLAARFVTHLRDALAGAVESWQAEFPT